MRQRAPEEPMSVVHEGFVTTGRRRFEHDSFPMRLFQKAKQLAWDPCALDLTTDRRNWPAVTEEEKDAIIGTLAVFQAGEESVTLDLLPLLGVVALEGRLEEEMYLTSFLFEEAKHTEFFNRWYREVPGLDGANLEHYLTPSYRRIFYEELPAAMWALRSDPSPSAQLRASVTYNMIVEGVLAETGYYGFLHQGLGSQEETMLPALLEGIGKLRQDEARHLAYGVYLISRLLAAEPALWDELQAHMGRLLPLAMGFINERLEDQMSRWGRLPHDIDPMVFVSYAQSQFQKRMARLEKARRQSLVEIEGMAVEAEALGSDEGSA
jgi:ribonucleoside-diphosphate reductase beta chain